MNVKQPTVKFCTYIIQLYPVKLKHPSQWAKLIFDWRSLFTADEDMLDWMGSDTSKISSWDVSWHGFCSRHYHTVSHIKLRQQCQIAASPRSPCLLPLTSTAFLVCLWQPAFYTTIKQGCSWWCGTVEMIQPILLCCYRPLLQVDSCAILLYSVSFCKSIYSY